MDIAVTDGSRLSMSEFIHLSVVDRVGMVTLDRPGALNSLNLQMVQAIQHSLERWRGDRNIAVVVIQGAGRAFCAGGDVREVRAATLEDRHDDNAAFLAAEYDLMATVSGYPKPIVSLIDGLCFGAGMGLAMHSRFRVVTERATMAMPETAIGLFPDVGASHFLPRLPGGVGLYLGLTGLAIPAADAVTFGVATHSVASHNAAELIAAIHREPLDCQGAIAAKQGSVGSGELAPHRSEIEAVFGNATLPEINNRLMLCSSKWAHRALDKLQSASPASLRATTALYYWGVRQSLSACLDRERRLALAMVRRHDFLEGVRAAIVDKDRKPRWRSRD